MLSSNNAVALDRQTHTQMESDAQEEDTTVTWMGGIVGRGCVGPRMSVGDDSADAWRQVLS